MDVCPYPVSTGAPFFAAHIYCSCMDEYDFRPQESAGSILNILEQLILVHPPFQNI